MQEPAIRILVTAFAPVPGSSPHASALVGMAAAVHGELDLITVKTEQLAHVDRIGDARMFRVPVGVGGAAERREAFGRAVERQLESERYDVVHVRGPYEGVIVARKHRDDDFRFVYEVATWPDEGEGPEAEVAWAQAHTLCLEEADLVLVPSEAAARSLAERGFAGKVAVVQPGVDVNTFDWWPSGQGEATRLLYLGSFAADRDLHTVLSAMRAVARQRPIEALVAGDPDPDRRERLRRMVKAFDLSGTVVVRGEPRAIAIPTLIGAADLCLAPAAATPRFQDFGDVPQPLLEYLAGRRPVVAAGVPGTAEVLRDEKEGLLYPPGDEKTLTDAILTLMAKDTLRARLVESAYDRVRWQLSAGARRRRIAEVYEMLVPGSQRYDAWAEGFGQEMTGLVQVPSELFELEEDLAVPEDDTGAAILAPTEVADDHPTPAFATPAGDDTSPGLYSPDDDADLPNVPTRIDAPTGSETDRHDGPITVDADTGPTASPGYDTEH